MYNNIIIYVSILTAFSAGLILGLLFLLFAERILRWQKREFADTREWVMQGSMYKFIGIKITSDRFYTWLYRTIGAGFVIGCGTAVFFLIYWIFKSPS